VLHKKAKQPPKRAGLRSGWPVFIPFFGALISLKEMPKCRKMEAEIAYGGLLFGTVASLACGALNLATFFRLPIQDSF